MIQGKWCVEVKRNRYVNANRLYAAARLVLNKRKFDLNYYLNCTDCLFNCLRVHCVRRLPEFVPVYLAVMRVQFSSLADRRHRSSTPGDFWVSDPVREALWNSLPSLSLSLTQYCSRFKTLLFRGAY